MDSWTDAFVRLGILGFSKAERGHESRSRLYLIRNGEVCLTLNQGLKQEYSSVPLGYLPRPKAVPHWKLNLLHELWAFPVCAKYHLNPT